MIIQVEDPRTGQLVPVEIAGDYPTPEESKIIEAEFSAASSDPGGFASKFIPRSTADWRPAIVGGGATVGGVIGTAAGPLGTAAGGILGAGAGSLVADLTELAAKKFMPGVSDPNLSHAELSGLGPTQRAIKEGAWEAAFAGAAQAARPLVKRAFQKFAFGGSVEDLAQARTRASAADTEGIPLGIEDISDKLRIRFFRKVLGRFPFLSKPFRESDVAKSSAVETALEKRVRQIAPSVTMAQAGVNLKRAARRKFVHLKNIFSKQYVDSIELARKTGARIPMQHTRVKASEIIEEMAGSRPRMEIETEEGIRYIPIPRAVKDKLTPFLKKLSQIEPDLRIEQYQALSDDLEDIIEFSRKQGFPMKKAFEMKKALELDLGDINVPAVKDLFQKANRDWFTMNRLFERPTAQKFTRVDRRIFGIGFEDLTTTEPNTKAFFKTVFDAGSPRAMTDLKKLVGVPEFNRAVRAHIDDVFTSAIERAGPRDSILNIDALRRGLGIFNKSSGEYASMAVALKNTGIRINDLSRLVNVLQIASEQGSVDVSTFIARRATLGGFRSAIRAVMPGASFAGGGIAASMGAAGSSSKIMTAMASLGVMIGLRKVGSLLTNPETMRALIKTIDVNLPIAQRDAAAARFMQLSARAGFGRIVNEVKTEVSRALGQSDEENAQYRGVQP